ncbi:hypothetical protein V6B16_02785 [Salinimicrobium catena]|uniref:hypothetical protein n=1 Tax=Salinimicrobium catena TaxID=390640 RepID=UPI002FE45E32
MKTLILCLLLMGFTAIGHSQIVLEETRVDYVPYSMKVDPVTNSVTLKIPESYYGEFQEDPLAFIEDNFSIDQFIRENEEHDFDSYEVYFKSMKGNVKASYDKDGEMVSTYQRFKNVNLPDDVKLEILRQFRHSRVLKNSHVVTSKNWMIDKEFYKVKIQDGDKVRRLRIDRNTQGLSLVGL